MSVGKAVALLGLGRKHLRLLPTDKELRLDVAALRQAVSSDRAAGRTPMAVVASAGTVVTGAVDPIADIVEVAKAEGLWVHVDGAYGARRRWSNRSCSGDSATSTRCPWTPTSGSISRWIAACCSTETPLPRGGPSRSPTTTLRHGPRSGRGDGVLRGDRGTLPTRACSQAVALAALPRPGILPGVHRRQLSQARRLAGLIDAAPDLERLAAVPLSAVCFRWTGADPAILDEANRAILERVNRWGRVYLSNATVRGRFVLRACITNHRTIDSDVDAVVEEVRAAASSA